MKNLLTQWENKEKKPRREILDKKPHLKKENLEKKTWS